MFMKTKRKNKIYCLIAFCLILALSALFGGLILKSVGVDVAYAAGGNTAYPPDKNFDINLKLDVNGEDASTALAENSVAAVESNNSKALRKRYLDITALLEHYRRIENGSNPNGIDDSVSSLYTSSNYGIANTPLLGGIYNSFEEYVTVSKKTGPGNWASGLIFEAKQYKTDPAPFIAVVLTKKTNIDKLPQEITVYITVEVESNFVAAKNRDSQGAFYLRGDFDGSNTAERLELANNTTVRYSLSEIVGSRLNEYKPLPLDFSTNDGNTRTPVKETESGTQGEDWLLRDISRFKVVPMTISGASRCVISVTGGDSVVDATPTVTIDVHFTENDVDKLGDAFWTGNHFLTLKFTDETGMEVTFSKRVYFIARSAPVAKSPYGMPVDLNASSVYQYAGDDKYVSKDAESTETPSSIKADVRSLGFAQVRVKPKDLCDYPSRGGLEFDVSLEKDEINVSPKNIVSLQIFYVKDASGNEVVPKKVDYYLITAEKKGSAVVEFPILYYQNSTTTNPGNTTIPVSFNVYGDYSMGSDTTITGKAQRRYSTISDDIFKQFINDDFYLYEAYIPVEDTESSSKLYVEKVNNELILTPLAQGRATVKLGFIDFDGRKITVDWVVNVNPEGGSAYVTWPTHYKILFWIGIGLACLAIILILVWLFVRALSKRKQEENETVAPTSAYIIKLNSQIAASQAQQRAVATQTTVSNTAQTQVLALGTGSSTAAATGAQPQDGNTLALGVAPPPMSSSFGSSTENSSTADENTAPPKATAKDDIAIPLSDDELLERIFIEKYEPRGMARRSFFKSKDLQNRELEKEKARIRDDVRDGMTIEEACKSLSERQSAQSSVLSGSDAVVSEEPKQETSILALIGFDPDSPLITEELTVIEETPESLSEEVALKNAENRLARIEKELEIVEERLSKTQKAFDKMKEAADNDENTLQLKEESNASLRKSIEDLEFKLATAKNKEKDKLMKDIENKENVISSNKEIVVKLQDELTAKRATLDELSGILGKYDEKKQALGTDKEKAVNVRDEAQENYNQAMQLLEQAKKAQETKEKLERLRPMLETVNTLDAEIRGLTNKAEKDAKEKDTYKAEVSDLQKQMLNTNDISVVNELSARMTELNKLVSELDKAIATSNKTKADKTIAFNGERRKANEFIDKEELEVEDVVKEEDDVIGKMAFDEYLQKTQQDRAQAEEQLTVLQASYDELVNGYDAEVMNIAVKTNAAVKEAEDALAEVQAELDILNQSMETASDDDKLMLSIDQMSLTEKLEQHKTALNELQASAAKEKVEYQIEYDNKLEETKKQIEEAQNNYDDASRKLDESMNKINPLDLILSGSGVISQDRQRMEAENLKKQLELSKSAMEQARLQAKMAQMNAEQAIVDAQRASDESKMEAERLAQEAIAKAEEARLAAEQKAEEEAEKARQEIEKAKQEAEEEKRRAAEEAERIKREAEEEAERAKKEAEEQAEQARREAEEEAERARKEAEEQAEQAKREAEEEAERARKEAEEEAERAKKEAEEQVEQAKKAAEEEAERLRLEAEEEKRRAEEEAEKARIAAEEEAEKARIAAAEAEERAKKEAEEEAAKKLAEENRIKEKIEKKKAHILEMRTELRNITEESVAKDLKEKFYNELMKLDEDEKSTSELSDLINKCMEDADHTAEVLMYKTLANKAPKRIVKKVTERINKIPKKKAGSRAGAARRPGARPSRPGARPSRPGARPSRPGARPTRPGGRPRPR